MKGRYFQGADYLIKGLRLIWKPPILPYVVVPLVINLVLFIFLSRYFLMQAEQWTSLLTSWLPNWLGFLGSLLWLMVVVALLLVWVFCFSLVAGLLASPFYGNLSAAIQRLHDQSDATSGRSVWHEIPHAIGREFRKFFYYLPRMLLLLVISWIPPFTLIAPILWFLFAAWMLTIQYVDYPSDNQGDPLLVTIRALKQHRRISLGFGSLVSLGMMIPLLNLVVMPGAVAGATLFYLDRIRPVKLEI